MYGGWPIRHSLYMEVHDSSIRSGAVALIRHGVTNRADPLRRLPVNQLDHGDHRRNAKRYECVRYFFFHKSDDIRTTFTETLNKVGVE
jgi:hypothetical protein